MYTIKVANNLLGLLANPITLFLADPVAQIRDFVSKIDDSLKVMDYFQKPTKDSNALVNRW